ncbi:MULTISPECIES: hypothetical protein [Mycetohabitans]|uniref:Trans-2-enoyl-CoA reductase-like protein n=1 Tax=Mycetohabitans endofungorum TaxID=417203 RepID=A0A2P5K868_9BURK|nr:MULTISPECIES: hypothetical protein [Mycetohabitans]PPB82917.1 trans-2-enoyl-CoA reductase-like protein [Mycetohabitans endofungorum]
MERAGSTAKLGTGGWYNTAAFEQAARGYYARSINGDVFYDALTKRVIPLYDIDADKKWVRDTVSKCGDPDRN